jgi:methionine-rich copper-binding protein CopC
VLHIIRASRTATLHRIGAAVLVTAFAALLTVLLGSAPASAHPSGVKATGAFPAPKQVVTEPLEHLQVTFSQPINPAGFSAQLTGPDGEKVALTKVWRTDTGALRASFPTLTQAGTYTVQVSVTAEGHPAGAAYTFSYQPPNESERSGFTMALVLGGILVAVIAAAVGFALFLARGRAKGSEEPDDSAAEQA